MLNRERIHLLPMICLCTALLVLRSPDSLAQEADADSRTARDRYFALPVEVDFDSGASNGDATIMRIAPLYVLPLSNGWELVNLNLVTIADAPGGVPGRPGNPNAEGAGRVFGIGDLVHASFFSPEPSGKLAVGFGGILSIPIATDSRLGSGKVSGGPAFRIVYRTKLWNLGAFGGQTWSFAGNDSRADVSQLIVRGAIRRQLPNDWYFVSAPIVTANWKAAGEKWLVPMGGGLGKVLSPNSRPWAVSLQGYYNVIKPDGAPDWVVRLAVIAAIPLGGE